MTHKIRPASQILAMSATLSSFFPEKERIRLSDDELVRIPIPDWRSALSDRNLSDDDVMLLTNIEQEANLVAKAHIINMIVALMIVDDTQTVRGCLKYIIYRYDEGDETRKS